MLARVLTLRFDPLRGGFDDAPLYDFLKDKEVLAIHDHFFVKNDTPYVTVVVTYTQAPAVAPAARPGTPQREDISWRQWVSEADVPLFNTLRDWRAERSKQDGIPPYVICTNRQFAAMLQARPHSLTALAEIQGFGKAKLEKYGQAILALLAPAVGKTPPEKAASAPGETTDALTR